MKTLRRDITVSAPQFIESEQETIFELAFSSEMPYEREYHTEDGVLTLKEILVHDENAVDLSLLNDKASVLFNHDFDNHIGCVVRDSARVDSDRVGRCLIQFSRVGTLANEVAGKVREGTLEKVSVGYNVLDYKIDHASGVMFVTSWQPYEVSLVSCPGDPSVGVGRSLNKDVIDLTIEDSAVEQPEVEEQKNQSDLEDEEQTQEQNSSEEQEQVNTEDTENKEEARSEEELNNEQEGEEKVENKSESSEEENDEEEEKPFERPQEDIEEMRSIGKYLNIPEEEVQRSINDKNLSVEDFKRSALNTNTESKTNSKGKITMTDNIKNLEARFDLSTAMRSLAEGKALTGAEAEYSQEMARKASQRGRAQRSNSVFVPTTALKPVNGEEIRTDSFVELLMEKSVLANLGVKVLSGLTAPIAIPRMSEGSLDAFGFVAENGVSQNADVKFDNVPMSLHTFTGGVPVTRQAMLTMPNIGAVIADHILKASRIKLEKAILSASANANARDGIVKQLTDAGLVTETAFTYKALLAEVAKLTDAGVDEDEIKFAMRGALKADLASTLRDEAVSGYIINDDGKLANRPVHSSGVLEAGHILVGSFSGITIGEWEGLEIDLDDTTYRSQGAIVPRVWCDLDWALTDKQCLRVLKAPSLKTK